MKNLFETTEYNAVFVEQINLLVGHPYEPLHSHTGDSVSSRSFHLKQMSPAFFDVLFSFNSVSHTKYLNEERTRTRLSVMAAQKGVMLKSVRLELRKQGLLVYFMPKLITADFMLQRTFVWAIPFYKLTLFTGNDISIHGDEGFIRLNADADKKSLRFIHRIVLQKSVSQDI